MANLYTEIEDILDEYIKAEQVECDGPLSIDGKDQAVNLLFQLFDRHQQELLQKLATKSSEMMKRVGEEDDYYGASNGLKETCRELDKMIHSLLNDED